MLHLIIRSLYFRSRTCEQYPRRTYNTVFRLSVLSCYATKSDSSLLSLQVDRRLVGISALALRLAEEKVMPVVDSEARTSPPQLIMLNPRYHGLRGMKLSSSTGSTDEIYSFHHSRFFIKNT